MKMILTMNGPNTTEFVLPRLSLAESPPFCTPGEHSSHLLLMLEMQNTKIDLFHCRSILDL